QTETRIYGRRFRLYFHSLETCKEYQHINYEPPILGGYKEADKEKPPHRPTFNAAAMSAPIDRPNNYGQAGHTYRSFEDWEREELIKNLSEALAVCDERI